MAPLLLPSTPALRRASVAPPAPRRASSPSFPGRGACCRGESAWRALDTRTGGSPLLASPASSGAESSPPVEVAPGVWHLAIPIPVPLRYVNAYLLRGHEGWTVVDTGFHTPDAEAAWQRALSALGIGPSDLVQIVVTHYHPDHFGCAGWLQGLSGAPVVMLAHERPQVTAFWHDGQPTGDGLAVFFARHGMPAELTADLPALHRDAMAMVRPLPQVRWVEPGDVIAAGARRFQVIWAPGHADGLMVLWEPDERLLLADDLVLATISPNISLFPLGDANPLARFLASLRRIRDLPARLVLPGHREPIVDLEGRARELATHHAQRLDAALGIVRRAIEESGRAPTAWEVNLQLFGPQPDLFRTRFAMGETLAHLEYLVDRGRLVRVEADEVVRYALR